MNTLISWIKDIMVVAVAIFVIKSILPESGTKKYAQMALSVVMIAVILSPVKNLNLSEVFEMVNASFENYDAVAVNSSISLENKASSIAAEQLRVLLATKLSASGFKDCEIKIFLDSHGDLRCVEIDGGHLDDKAKEEIVKITTETLGIDRSYLVI